MQHLRDLKIDSNTALFLDRDGVINKRLPGDYVKSWEAFHFLPGVPEAFRIFHRYFLRIIIVTNQQGIGKGLMTETALQNIHHNMQDVIMQNGGRVDRIYHCPDLASTPGSCRKPSPAMALQAQRDFPEIVLPNAIMAGDTESDIAFARNSSMMAVLVSPQTFELKNKGMQPDIVVKDLLYFALKIQEAN
jgi:histidinol-phosphate phosphatase family protein